MRVYSRSSAAPAATPAKAMTTDVSAALATLQLHPEDSQALKALAAIHPGNGAGIDADALSKALSDARRFHRERGDYELVTSLIDLELAWTTEAARRADLLHEKGRLLSDELLRDEAGVKCVREALDASPGHAAATESLAQMTLVRANWEPISKRYLQQAEGAKDPALASSLYGSVAEFHLKYRPADGEGETFLRRSLELDPHNRRSGNNFERVLRDKGSNEELLTLVRGARRSRRQPRGARAGGDRGRRAVRQDEPRGRRLHALPQGAGRQPDRAARAARRPRRAVAPARVGGAGQGAGVRRAQQARRAGRGAAAGPGDADLEAPEPARHGGGGLPARAQAGRVEPRDGRVLSRVLHREERAAAAADGPRAGAEDRRRRRAPGRDGHGDGARRGEAPAARREGDRDLEGDPAPQAAPARGGDVAARPLHEDREVERAARALEGRSGRGAGRQRRRKDQSLPGDRRDLSRSLEPRRDGGEHLSQHPGAQAGSPGGAGGAGVPLRGAGAIRRPGAGVDPAGGGVGRRRRARRAAPPDRRAVGRQARQTRQRDRQLREDLRGGSNRRRDQHAAEGSIHEGARLAAADRGLSARAAPPGRGGAAGAADRDGEGRGRSPERRARIDLALQPGAGGRGA